MGKSDGLSASGNPVLLTDGSQAGASFYQGCLPADGSGKKTGTIKRSTASEAAKAAALDDIGKALPQRFIVSTGSGQSETVMG